MTTLHRTFWIFSLSVALFASGAALAVPPQRPATPPTPTAKPAPVAPTNTKAPAGKAPVAQPKPTEEPVAYDKLELHVGKDVAVQTTFNTVRRGTLVKYTGAALTLKTKPEDGGFELTVPRETIRQTLVTMPGADPLFSNEGAAGAKKN